MATVTVSLEQARDHMKAMLADRDTQMHFAVTHNLLDVFRRAEHDWYVFREVLDVLDQKILSMQPAKPAERR